MFNHLANQLIDSLFKKICLLFQKLVYNITHYLDDLENGMFIDELYYDEELLKSEFAKMEKLPENTLDIILILEDIEYHKKQNKIILL
jgi:hypothetical protein